MLHPPGFTILHSASRIVLPALFSLLSACATTTLDNSWRDPQYSGGPVTKVLIAGISNQASVRRTFEDTFSGMLRTEGVEAIASHVVVPEDGQMPEDKLRAAVDQSGAGAVLITRMVQRQTEISVTSATPMPPAAGVRLRGYYGAYSGAWIGYYEPTTVRQYEYIVAETTLFVGENPRPVWSGTTRTIESKDIRGATEGFAKPVIQALKKEGLI